MSRTYARNDITGRVIKTDVPNKLYDIGWEKAFNKQPSTFWLEQVQTNVVIEEATGWDDDVTLETPIKYKEFLERLEKSKYKKDE